ncbi:MAG: hypothetical protein AAF383_23290 [Cyanobacteria bacterium P01_A01_bin.83]
MLPLTILPGKGAELDRGFGVALSGLALSTFLTPTVILALMGLLQDFKPRRSKQEQEYEQEEAMELMKDES